MARTVRAVQSVIAVLGLLLVAVVLGFIAYAHHRAQNYLAGLPKRLGIDIRQETDNVTYSQSFQGRTVFTVHAARQIQHADGKYTLKDASVILYGRDAAGAGTMDLKRADKIRGSEFEYDQKNGVLAAAGDVYLDLAAPAGKNVSDEARVVHIKTSGLTYLQKERTATTDKEIDFEAGGMTGHALGATYNGATGVVLLHAAVAVNGVRDGRPVQLTASAAELDRVGNVARLTGAEYKTSSRPGSESGAESLLADHAVVNLQKDGTPHQLQADGHVTLKQAGKGTLAGQRLEVSFNDTGLMQAAHVAGAVRFQSVAAGRQESGATDDLRVAFTASGQPQHARLTGNVALKQKSLAGSRVLGSQQLDLDFAGNGTRTALLRAATASGHATLDDSNLPTRTESHVEAGTLVGQFAAANQLTQLDGHGATMLRQTVSSAVGAVLRKDVSTGAELRLNLHAGPGGRSELVRAEQRGDVVADRQAAAKKPGDPAVTEHVRAQDAVFEAGANRVLLTGGPGGTGGVQMTDASSLLVANAVTLDRAQDVATASGAVKVSYVQAAGKSQAEPVHVQAAQAVMHKSTGIAEFTTPGGLVRMWQAGSVIEAPVIDLDQTTKTVFAKDGVRAVLTGAPAKNGVTQPVRVQAATMKYADAAHTIDLTGPVRVDDANGRMTANDAVLTLAAASEKAAPALLGAGRVERVVATGDVAVIQPGRKATGERLVYTAADGLFLLTGSKAAPPRVTDAARGTIAGTEIRFTHGEDSVVVTGGDGVRVRTETRVKQ